MLCSDVNLLAMVVLKTNGVPDPPATSNYPYSICTYHIKKRESSQMTPKSPALTKVCAIHLLYFIFSFRLYPSASRGESNVCRLPGEWLVEATSREPQQCQPRSHSISFSVFLLLSSQSVWCYRP